MNTINCLIKFIFIAWCCLSLCWTVEAQVDSSTIAYSAINEDLFVNTKWKYTYATHAESNTIIHKADELYEYFLFFKYDYSYQMYLNGKMTYGLWKLNEAENELNYNFRNIKWWRIASFTDEALVLEFNMNNRASYRYHFIRVADEDAPFIRSANDLPDIDVSYAPTDVAEADYYLNYLESRGVKYNASKWERRKRRRELREQKRRERLQKTERGRKILEEEEPKELIQIELVGGGFYGGVDPVYRNMTLIKTDGRVIREYQTELQGLRVSKHTISREALEQLVTYIEDKQFFDLDQVYTCESAECIKRLQTKPRPIALRIAVTKGVQRKIITISMWDGQGVNKSLINYPKELDAIVQAIENIAIPPQ